MASPPTVSVIVPCYKQAQYLAACIESALTQEGSNVQVIVVDDGSPDDTAAVADRYAGRIVFVQQANQGVGAARNAGLARATGEYVHFLDADDYLLPRMTVTHLAAMKAQSADVTCSGWQMIAPSGAVFEERQCGPFLPDPYHSLLPVNRCPPVAYLFRRSVISAINGFDPDRRMSGHEDWDLFLRVAANGAKFAVVNAILGAYRVHASSASSRYASMYDSGIFVLDKARRSHGRCANCGNRWRKAYAAFYAGYVEHLFRPTLRRRATTPVPRDFWWHFFSRAWSRPSLAIVTLDYLFSAFPRRLRFARPIVREGDSAP